MLRFITKKIGQRDLRKSTKDVLTQIKNIQDERTTLAQATAREYDSFIAEFDSIKGFMEADDEDKNYFFQQTEKDMKLFAGDPKMIWLGKGIILQYALCISFELNKEISLIEEEINALRKEANDFDEHLKQADELYDIKKDLGLY